MCEGGRLERMAGDASEARNGDRHQPDIRADVEKRPLIAVLDEERLEDIDEFWRESPCLNVPPQEGGVGIQRASHGPDIAVSDDTGDPEPGAEAHEEVFRTGAVHEGVKQGTASAPGQVERGTHEEI